jgi:hypothetical protein
MTRGSLLLAVLLAGCATGTPSATETQRATGIPVPTVTLAAGIDSCVGVDVTPHLILRGDPAQSPPVFVEQTGHASLPIYWPPDGYVAIFDPGLKVLAPDGHVVAREGDDLSANDYQWPGLVICPQISRVDVYRVSDFATPH